MGLRTECVRTALRPRALIDGAGGPKPRHARLPVGGPPAPAPGAPRRSQWRPLLRPSAPLSTAPRPHSPGTDGRSGAFCARSTQSSLTPRHRVLAPPHRQRQPPWVTARGPGRGCRRFPYSHLTYSDTWSSHRGLGHFLGLSPRPLRFCEMGRSSAA